jgi:hypothetical protein
MADQQTTTTGSSDAGFGTKDNPRKYIYLVSYPKIVFLYPTFFAALVAGTYMAFAGEMPPTDEPNGSRHTSELVATAFLVIAGINLVVLSFDFPRTTSLTLFFFGVAVVTLLMLLFRNKPDLLPGVYTALSHLRPWANSQFYFIFAGILGLIYAIVLVNVQFDYWEVRPNELLHHHGILSNKKRFPAPSLRVDKEINDIFEYMLLRSGRLILHPANEPRAIVLENIFFINHKEEQLRQMLGALQVQIRHDRM